MSEERLKEIEDWTQNISSIRSEHVAELIDEIRFLQAALADARKGLDRSPDCVVNP